MKKSIVIIVVFVLFAVYASAQNIQFHSATSGVKIKYNNSLVWRNPPERLTYISGSDVFSLNKNDRVSIIKNNIIYHLKSKGVIKISANEILNKRTNGIFEIIIKKINENAKSNRSVSGYQAFSAGASVMSGSNNKESQLAWQILNYINASYELKGEFVDSNIVLQKRYISSDEFYFRLKNNSQNDLYIYVFQYKNQKAQVTFDQTWNSEDGLVSLVFYLKPSSSLDIDDFLFYEDGETVYFPVASHSKININLLQERINEKITANMTDSIKHIGICTKANE